MPCKSSTNVAVDEEKKFIKAKSKKKSKVMAVYFDRIFFANSINSWYGTDADILSVQDFAQSFR